MARDIEDGNYTRIHNDILDAMAVANLTIREYKCLIFLLRKTYGWSRKEDAISLEQWSSGTGLSISAVAQTLNKLEQKNIISRDRSAGGRSKTTTYSFNKYFEQWRETVSVETVSEETVLKPLNSVGSVKKTVSVLTDTKESKEITTANAVAPMAPQSPFIQTFRAMQDDLRTTNNRTAKLYEMYVFLYGNGADAPSYGRLGKVAKEVGGAGRLAELLLQNCARPPTGDVLAYIQASHKRHKMDQQDNRAIQTLEFDN